MGPGAHRRGARARSRLPAARRTRPVPDPSRHRRGPRRRGHRGGHRLVADRRALRPALRAGVRTRWSHSTAPSRSPRSTGPPMVSPPWTRSTPAALEDYQPYHAARADLLARAGRARRPRAPRYDRAIELSTNPTERAFLDQQRAGLSSTGGCGPEDPRNWAGMLRPLSVARGVLQSRRTATRRLVPVSTELLDRARAGDGDAFRQVAEPHRHELQLHCYRMLGSVQDAEDALQDTLLAAWRGFDAFEGRSSLRTWLYQVATNRCLNILRAKRRRPVVNALPTGRRSPGAEPDRRGDLARALPGRAPGWARRAARARRPLRGERGDLDRVPHRAPVALGAPAQCPHPPRRPRLSGARSRHDARDERGVGDECTQTRARHRRATARTDRSRPTTPRRGLTRRARPRRSSDPLLRSRRHRHTRDVAHRRRRGDDAADAARVLRHRASGAVHGRDHLPRRSYLPPRRDPRQRPARVRDLRP